MVTWRELIGDVMKANNDTWDDVEHVALAPQSTWYRAAPQPEPSLDTEFDNGYGGECGCRFTVWTHKHVYSPVCHDGAEWAASVPRNPCDVASAHVGGG